LCNLIGRELLCLLGDLHAFERFRSHEHAHDFRHLIGPALSHREVWRAVVLRWDLEQSTNSNLVIAACGPRGRKDQIGLSQTAVRVLLAVDYIKITSAYSFNADSQAVSLNQSSAG